MELIVKQIHMLLLKNKKTIAVAESCTGGLISKILTDNPGSSNYFLAGIVSYNNKAKEKILKIPAAIIKKHAAVSKEIASLMAKSIQKISGADLGIGVTGIAGPGGGTKNKPVGTIFIAISGAGFSVTRKLRLKGTRANIRKQTATAALKLLKSKL